MAKLFIVLGVFICDVGLGLIHPGLGILGVGVIFVAIGTVGMKIDEKEQQARGVKQARQGG